MKTKTISCWVLIAALAGLVPAACLAQAPAASARSSSAKSSATRRAAPRPDDIDPGVDTSADVHGEAGGSAAAPVTQTGKSGQTGRSGKPAGKPGTKPATAKGAGKTEDHLQLDTTDVTGNSELPKVMAIVPWKRADLGDLGKPMNSLVDEVLQPIDRDVFQRQTRYYDALKPDARTSVAAGPPASGGNR